MERKREEGRMQNAYVVIFLWVRLKLENFKQKERKIKENIISRLYDEKTLEILRL